MKTSGSQVLSFHRLRLLRGGRAPIGSKKTDNCLSTKARNQNVTDITTATRRSSRPCHILHLETSKRSHSSEGRTTWYVRWCCTDCYMKWCKGSRASSIAAWFHCTHREKGTSSWSSSRLWMARAKKEPIRDVHVWHSGTPKKTEPASSAAPLSANPGCQPLALCLGVLLHCSSATVRACRPTARPVAPTMSLQQHHFHMEAKRASKHWKTCRPLPNK